MRGLEARAREIGERRAKRLRDELVEGWRELSGVDVAVSGGEVMVEGRRLMVRGSGFSTARETNRGWE